MLFFLLLFSRANTLLFEYQLQPEEQVCFFEQLTLNTIVVADMSGPYKDSKIRAYVLSPERDLTYMSNITTPVFSFTTQTSGNFSFCFQNLVEEKGQFRLKFLIGAEATDYQDLAKKGDLNKVDQELMQMDSLLGTMRMQMKFNVEKENNNIAMWELVNYKVIGFCVILVITMFFLTYVSGQYVKNYFQNKKML